MIITIGNNKGGTGKTTVAAHLAIALGKQKKNVLVIDNDTQCNCTSLLINGNSQGFSLYDLYEADPTSPDFNIKDYIITSSCGFCSLIPNIVETSGIFIDWGRDGWKHSINNLRDRITEQTKEYDYVIIDNPPTLDLPLGLSLNASDAVIVPMEVGSSHSLRGLAAVLKMIKAIQGLNPNLRFLKLVLNRADMRTSISKAMIKKVKDDYGEKVCFKTIIPSCTAIQQAEFLGRTLFRHKPSSKVTTLFRDMASELQEITQNG